jgi:hypothetical protein
MVTPPLLHGALVYLGDGKPRLPLVVVPLVISQHKVRLWSDHLGLPLRHDLGEVHVMAGPAKSPRCGIVCAGGQLLVLEGVEAHTLSCGRDFGRNTAPRLHVDTDEMSGA